MAEQSFKRERASSFGGNAPKRKSGHKRPLAKLAVGHNQTNWLLVPNGLVINPPNKSDYTYWLECVVRLLGAHADGQGKAIIELRKKLAAVRKSNRELRASTSVDELTQNAQLSRQNREQAEEIKELGRQLEECRSSFNLIDISKDEKKENVQARAAKAIREAAAANEKKIQELEKLARELDSRRINAEKKEAKEAKASAKSAEIHSDILENFLRLIEDFNEVSYVDAMQRSMPNGTSSAASLTLSDDAGLELRYTRNTKGVWALSASSMENADEPILKQTLKLDATGQLTEDGFRHLERLVKAVTWEGKAELKREIGATKQYQEIYG